VEELKVLINGGEFVEYEPPPERLRAKKGSGDQKPGITAGLEEPLNKDTPNSPK
jgi:hypothetical protein